MSWSRSQDEAMMRGMAQRVAHDEAAHRRRGVRVTFDNGDHILTEINGTEETITEYYKIGREFNIGVTRDRMVKVAKLEFLD